MREPKYWGGYHQRYTVLDTFCLLMDSSRGNYGELLRLFHNFEQALFDRDSLGYYIREFLLVLEQSLRKEWMGMISPTKLLE